MFTCSGVLDRVVRQIREISNAIENIQKVNTVKAFELAIATYNRKPQKSMHNKSPIEISERGFFEKPWQILCSKTNNAHFDYFENKKIIDKKMANAKKYFPILQAVHVSRDRFFIKRTKKTKIFAKRSFEPAFTSEIFYVTSYKRPVIFSEPVMMKICDAKGNIFPKSFYSYQLKKALVFTSQKMKIDNVVKSFYKNGVKFNVVQFQKFGKRTFDINQSNMNFFEK